MNYYIGIDLGTSGAKLLLTDETGAICRSVTKEYPLSFPRPGYGGAMLAMVGCGAYESVADVCARLVRVKETVEPDPEIAARYEARYRQFKRIYPTMKPLFQALL